MRKIIAVLAAAALVATGCSSKESEDYLKSSERGLSGAHTMVYLRVADTVIKGEKTLGEWDLFPVISSKPLNSSGREVCTQFRKEAPTPNPNFTFLLACSKDSRHAVVVPAKDGKPAETVGIDYVMLDDATIFEDSGGVLIVSLTNTGASARTSSNRLSVQRLKELDDELRRRWEEAYEKYFHGKLFL